MSSRGSMFAGRRGWAGIVAVWSVMLAFGVLATSARASTPLDHIFWSDPSAGTIGMANLDGAGVNQSFIAGLTDPLGVAVDRQHIYWTNNQAGLIGRANLNGTHVNQAFISGASSPRGITVSHHHIYWANSSTGTIGRARLDGTHVNEKFITANTPAEVAGQKFPYDVAVAGGYVYWTDWLGPLGRAKRDGTIASNGFNNNFGPSTEPELGSGLAVYNQHLYWNDDAACGIGTANLDGTDATDDLANPYYDCPGTGLAVSGGHIYFSGTYDNSLAPHNGEGSVIGVLNLDGSDNNLGLFWSPDPSLGFVAVSQARWFYHRARAGRAGAAA